MIDTEKLDRIVADLDSAKQRATQIAVLKAQAEVSALQREAVAYYDGAYDAIKYVKQLLAEDGKACATNGLSR